MTVPSLSGLSPSIQFIWDLYEEASVGLLDRETKLLAILDSGMALGSDYDRFSYMTKDEVRSFFKDSQDELHAMIVLDLLSAVEGRLRDDFEKRAQDPTRMDPISKDFKVIARSCIRDRKTTPFNLQGLLEVWSIHLPHVKISIEIFKKYWPFRNWLAHGRWTELPFGGHSLPSPNDVKDAIEILLSNFCIPTN